MEGNFYQERQGVENFGKLKEVLWVESFNFMQKLQNLTEKFRSFFFNNLMIFRGENSEHFAQ